VTHALGFALSPNGRSAYVGVDGIAQFNISPSGALSPKTPAIVRVPGVQFPGIGHVVVSPSGRQLYGSVSTRGTSVTAAAVQPVALSSLTPTVTSVATG
jgi:hypothetical protein